MKRLTLFFLLFSGMAWFIIGLSICNTFASSQIHVFASILPQKYFIEKIGGEWVSVSVMVEPGANPHTYEPKPKQMALMAKAKLYFAIGIRFEDIWLPRIAPFNPEMRIIRTQDGIQKYPMAHHEHSEDATDHHKTDNPDHGTDDPHIWLAPHLVKLIARNILQSLVMNDPDHSLIYLSNYRQFINELTDLDTELIAASLKEKSRKEFMVFHPSWGYLARAYGLEQVPIEIEGKEPKAAELKDLIQFAREHHIRKIFVQPQMSRRNAEVIANAIQGTIVVADPLDPNWNEMMRNMIQEIIQKQE